MNCKKISNKAVIKPQKAKIKSTQRIIYKGGIQMNKTVSTKTLFNSNDNYSTMNENEKQNYINKLSMEFISSARELLESLRDK